MHTISSQEKSRAIDYLLETRDELLKSVGELSESQWHFKPAPDRWSVAETLEHIVFVETRVHAIIGRMPEAPEAEPGTDPSVTDNVVLKEVPDRTTKVQGPAAVLPTGQSPTESLHRFHQGRARTLELLESASFLRGRVVPHPLLGPWDGYQWILAAGAHCARHTCQISEVKSDALFPNAADSSTEAACAT